MKEETQRWGRGIVTWCGIALLAWLAAGCRTALPLPPVNASEAGWTLRQGQAVWRANAEAPEIAGEMLVATNPDGRTLLQFTKNPLPFVTVQTSNQVWQIDIAPRKRRYSGHGQPTARLIWVHLARALNGEAVRLPLVFTRTDNKRWQIENKSTGEQVAGFIN